MAAKKNVPSNLSSANPPAEGFLTDLLEQFKDPAKLAALLALFSQFFKKQAEDSMPKGASGDDPWKRPDGMKGCDPCCCLHASLHYQLAAVQITLNHLASEQDDHDPVDPEPVPTPTE